MFRIGIIGCGWIVRLSHIPAILKNPQRGVIVAFYSRTLKSAKKTMKGYHKKIKRLLRRTKDEKIKKELKRGLESKVYRDIEELFKTVEGVVIATSPNTHIQFAKMAAEHGKSIMLEKPAARTLYEIEKVYSTLEKVPLYVYSQRSYDESIDVGREIVESGKLGRIKSFRGSLGNAVLNYVRNKEQFWNPRISGGGALLDLGPHVYSVFRNWFDQEYKFESVREIEIATINKTRRMFKQKNYKIEIDDKAIIEVKFSHPENGEVRARFETYWGNSDLYPKGAIQGNYFEAVGEKGKMTIAGSDNYLIEYNNGEIEIVPIEGEFLSTGDENTYKAFILQKESRNPTWFALEMMEILEGGYISHHLGGKTLTKEEIYNFIHGFEFITKCEERSLAIIQALFPIEK